ARGGRYPWAEAFHCSRPHAMYPCQFFHTLERSIFLASVSNLGRQLFAHAGELHEFSSPGAIEINALILDSGNFHLGGPACPARVCVDLKCEARCGQTENKGERELSRPRAMKRRCGR